VMASLIKVGITNLSIITSSSAQKTKEESQRRK